MSITGLHASSFGVMSAQDASMYFLDYLLSVGATSFCAKVENTCAVVGLDKLPLKKLA